LITLQGSTSLFQVGPNVQKNSGLLKLEEIFSTLSDAESRVRGYVMKRKPANDFDKVDLINSETSRHPQFELVTEIRFALHSSKDI
jgi:hypothetical protein